jgi:hypothetical protein
MVFVCDEGPVEPHIFITGGSRLSTLREVPRCKVARKALLGKSWVCFQEH